MRIYLVLMLAILLPATTFSQTLIDGVYYYLFNDGEAYVAENPEASGAVVIPESVIFAGNAYNVTRIYSNAFKDCTGLTSISIPDGVTVIESSAFRGCTQLASIAFPSNLKTIGDYAFRNCSKLTSIVIPDGVTTIGTYAFYGCTKIASVSFPSSLVSVGSDVIDTSSTWYKNQTNNSVVYAGTVALLFKGTIPATISITDGTIVIADEAFSGSNTTLTRVNIPASVRHIGNSAFSNKTNLSTIYFYNVNNLQSIGLSAFNNTQYGNSNIGVSGTVGYIGNIAYKFNGTMPSDTELVLKSGTVAIAGGAFSGCTGLKSITIPNTVTNIGRQAFYGCTALESITIPSSVTTIGNYAFYGSRLTSVTIPNTVTNLGVGLFYSCRQLESATISDGIERIPSDLFANCEYLETVAIPSSVKIIESRAFLYCALTSINIPENVVIIEDNAFFQQSDDWNYNVSPATSLELPACVAKIGDRAFGNLKKITSVTALMETPVAISANTFYSYGLSKATLTVPAKSKAAYEAASYWQNFGEIRGIGKVDQTLDLVAIPTMTYGDAAYNLPEETNEGLTLTWEVDDTDIATISSNILTITGTGSTTVTATQAGNDSYEQFSKEFSLTVNKAPLTITAINKNMTYGDNVPAYGVNYSGFVYSETSAILTTQPTIACSATNTSNVGTYNIVPSGATAANYDITFVNGILTINKAPLTITAKSYTINQKDDLPEFEVTYDGFKNEETSSVLTAQPIVTCDATDSETAGDFDITPSGAVATNYNFNYVSGTLTVNEVESVTIAMRTGSGDARSMIAYSSKYALDFTDRPELKAYIACGYNSNREVLLVHVSVVPPYTGMVIKTTNGIYDGGDYDVPTTTEDYYYANLLVPVVETETVTPTEIIDDVEYTNFTIGTLVGGGIGFVKLNSNWTTHNKSYLRVPTSLYNNTAYAKAIKGFGVEFVEGERATAILNAKHDAQENEDDYYDLLGRKVKPISKGFYIHKGKKVFIK